MLTKIIDGQVVELSSEEEVSILAEWAANDPNSSEQQLKNEYEQAKAYLAETDYKMIRVAEGYLIDDSVKTLREQARDVIRKYLESLSK